MRVVPLMLQAKSAASAPPRVQPNVLPVSVSVMVPASMVPVPEFSATLIASSESAAW